MNADFDPTSIPFYARMNRKEVSTEALVSSLQALAWNKHKGVSSSKQDLETTCDASYAGRQPCSCGAEGHNQKVDDLTEEIVKRIKKMRAKNG